MKKINQIREIVFGVFALVSALSIYALTVYEYVTSVELPEMFIPRFILGALGVLGCTVPAAIYVIIISLKKR